MSMRAENPYHLEETFEIQPTFFQRDGVSGNVFHLDLQAN